MAIYVHTVIVLIVYVTLSQSNPLHDEDIASRFAADASSNTDNSISSSDDDYFIDAMDNFAKQASKYPDPGIGGYVGYFH